jgi:N-acetylneuraminic acid mutarotase
MDRLLNLGAGGRMKQGITWYTILAIGTGVLTGCGDQATEPAPPGATADAATASAVGSDRWIARAAMPSAQTGLAVAVLGNGSGKPIVYAIAGHRTNTVQAYDVSTNTWSRKANYPEAAGFTNGAGVINGKIYVSGGVTGSETVSRRLYQYNPATNVWTRKHDMPAASYYGVTGVIGGRLYVLTACDEVCPPVKAFWRYNPGTDNWTSLPTPPSDHNEGAGTVIGGKFYVVGGGSDQPAGTQLDVFDPATNR